MGETLCWTCKNAVPDLSGQGCSWSRSFIPVEGWKAIMTQWDKSRKSCSYEVIQCPQRLPDERKETVLEEDLWEDSSEERGTITIRSGMGTLRKALSVWQPYASLLVSGEKEFETRSWSTAYRGPLAICSTMTNPYQVVSGLAAYTAKVIGEKLHGTELDKLPLGHVLGIVELIDCVPITWEFIEELKVSEEVLGNFKVGHFAWRFGKRKWLGKPVPVKGRQGLWTIERDTWREMEKFL